MKLKTVPISSIKPYEHNPRRNDDAVDAVAESIRQCSYVAPIVVDENNVILAGHTRWKALQQLGRTTAQVCIADGLTEEQKRKYRILDNKTAEIAEWDDDLLRIELDGLDFEGFDFGLLELTAAPAEPAAPPEITEDDFDPEPPEEPVAQRGQIWQLGRHRLMCGDATSLADVQMCIGGGRLADMVFTDPPYGVAIGDKNKALDEVGGKSGQCKDNIQGDCLPEAELYELLKTAFTNVRQATAADACYFVTSPQGGSLGLMMMMMMRDAGLPVRHVLMWRKNAPTFSIGRLDYDYQHEPIFYTWTESHHNYRAGAFRSTIWDFPKPTASRLHPTMKPVALVANAILDGTLEGMTVLDPFGGSGTTLIACEQTGRCCRMLEIDPHYCDVIIRRWEEFTGEKAALLDGV